MCYVYGSISFIDDNLDIVRIYKRIRPEILVFRDLKGKLPDFCLILSMVVTTGTYNGIIYLFKGKEQQYSNCWGAASRFEARITGYVNGLVELPP